MGFVLTIKGQELIDRFTRLATDATQKAEQMIEQQATLTRAGMPAEKGAVAIANWKRTAAENTFLAAHTDPDALFSMDRYEALKMFGFVGDDEDNPF